MKREQILNKMEIRTSIGIGRFFLNVAALCNLVQQSVFNSLKCLTDDMDFELEVENPSGFMREIDEIRWKKFWYKICAVQCQDILDKREKWYW